MLIHVECNLDIRDLFSGPDNSLISGLHCIGIITIALIRYESLIDNKDSKTDIV